MSTITSLVGTGTLSADRSTINSNFTALQGCFIGSSAPTSPIAGQLWLDNSTATEALKIYDGAAWRTLAADAFGTTGGGGNLPLSGGTMTGAIDFGGYDLTNVGNADAAGEATNKGQVDARVREITVPLGTLSATDNKYLAAAGTGTWTITDVLIISETGVTSDASNLWTFNVRNLTASVNLRSAAKSTNGAAITADTAYALGLDQNLSPTSADVLQLQMTKTGSPNPLTEAVAVLRYTLAT